MSSCSHVVFTYQDPSALVARVVSWIQPTLERGGGVLLACTQEHAAGIRDALHEAGVDATSFERDGRLAIRDGNALLARFMVDGKPHGGEFKRIARGLLTGLRASGAQGTIRVWGEMVDILAKGGSHQAADRLERLWEDVLEEEHVELLCSYELDSLDAATHARVLLDVCRSHGWLEAEHDHALESAVSQALIVLLGEEAGLRIRRVLPTRHALLTRMSPGSAVLVSLRAIDAEFGDHVARRARSILVTPAVSSVPR